MMRWLLVTVLLMVGFSLATQVMLQDPGYVMVALGNKTLHMRFWPAVLLLTLAWISLYLLLKGLQKLLQLSRGRGWSADNSPRNSAKRLQALVLHYFEGDWTRLLKEAKRALKQREDLIPSLLAAQAAFELGDTAQQRAFLTAAGAGHPRQQLAIGMLEAKLLMAQGHSQQASALLQELHREYPGRPATLQLLAQALEQQQAWAELGALLPDLKRLKTLSSEGFGSLEMKVNLGQLNGAEDVDSLQSRWKQLTKSRKQDFAALSIYLRGLMRLGRDDLAEPLIRKSLQQEWSEDLVALYGRLDQTNPQDCLRHAENWLSQQSQSPGLLLTLGRLCRRLELWGRARDYFEQAHNMAPSAQALVGLAEVYTKLGDKAKSQELYERGLTEIALQEAKA